jgi:hypothetical protein
MKNIKNALVNENTAALILDAPDTAQALVTTPATKPRQFIVGTSEKAKAMIDELCKELQVRGKTGKLIDLPSHAAVEMLLEIATDHRFHQVEVNDELLTLDRFEEFRAKFEADRNQERVQTPAELMAEIEKLQARLAGLKG